MKNIVIAIIIAGLFSITGCTNESIDEENNSGNIQISFHNKTGKKIENLVANGKQIGTLQNNGKTDYIAYESFGVDTGMPDVPFTGTVSGNTIESTNRFYFCGTQKYKITEGKYHIEIYLNTVDEQPYFDLRFVESLPEYMPSKNN
jgi:hypothetical protein